jgi:predicted phosphodiesterase
MCPFWPQLDYNPSSLESSLRYLILSDIHSNAEALEKCLQISDSRYDEVLCLGDLVGYGPDPNSVVDRIRDIAKVILRGNHDKACCGLTDGQDFNPLARLATLWTRRELTPEHAEFLRNLPVGPVDLEDFELVHGSPRDEDEYLFDSRGALEALRHQRTQAVLFGHTHYQGGFRLYPKGQFEVIHNSSDDDGCTLNLPLEDGSRYLINPGSVGQPRDGDWRAAFAIFDSNQRCVEYYRTAYDLPATQAKMRSAGLPEPLIKRLEIGR